MNSKSKIYRLIIALCVLSTGVTSCSDWLDVKPKSEIKGDELFKTEQGFEDALTGVYILMTDTRIYGREMTFGFLETLAWQYEMNQMTNSYYDGAQYQYETEKALARIDNIWSASYNVIANLNNILENLETNGSSVTPPVYARIKGECLGLRAFLHFDLLRLFGWGNLKERPEIMDRLAIPYVKKYAKDVTKQSTLREVLGYIEADLSEAEGILPHAVAKSKLTFNYYALLATQARVALWKGDRVAALKYAELLISFGPDFPWVTQGSIANNTIENRDLTFSTEYIFGLNMYQFEKITKAAFEPRLNEVDDNPDYFFHSAETADKLFELDGDIGVGDYRYLWLYDKLGTKYSFLKLNQPDKSKLVGQLPLIQRAEIYYMAAECLNESGSVSDRQKAINYLNTVRERRGILQKLPATLEQAQVQEELLKEWRKELLLEGQMFYYYKRRGMASIPGSNIKMDDKNYVLPLPHDEVAFGGRENNKN